ncbi:hypothetical protein DFA_01315 [Cavenderia fasciculata]|uniref:UBC core domain-containing protein n=1 Tax=Cavenderia fasciculata TaxID=261658 RepID=F4PS48_CACFS|nr:uncharacterized protein DFA_01315 [Cavenderia fasciculata]EGG21431.1 hypothetical protein DFA_01315 [Cavenderia fasciculata]|eukprot:XP_004359281.1 hypothetical protein DFA_01315 [Cavenderia fasciculata]
MLKRVNKEMMDWSNNHPNWATLDRFDHDTLTLEFTIMGPPDTPYSGGVFKVHAKLPIDYPFKRPSMSIQTPIYHPNISSSICCCLIPELEGWSPMYTVARCIGQLYQILIEPVIDHPCEIDISTQFKENRELFDLVAAEHTKQNAMPHLAA